MTDKEKILSAVNGLLEGVSIGLSEYDAGFENGQFEAYKKVIDVIKSIPEEPVNEDLLGIAMELEDSIGTSPHSRMSIVEHLVKATNWQKEQMEKERLKDCDNLTKEQYELESEFVIQHFKKNNRTPTFCDAIEYGMKLQKEQMMKDAVDGKFSWYDGDMCIDIDDSMLLYIYKHNQLKDGDKVKVIIIKEDEK